MSLLVTPARIVGNTVIGNIIGNTVIGNTVTVIGKAVIGNIVGGNGVNVVTGNIVGITGNIVGGCWLRMREECYGYHRSVSISRRALGQARRGVSRYRLADALNRGEGPDAQARGYL